MYSGKHCSLETNHRSPTPPARRLSGAKLQRSFPGPGASTCQVLQTETQEAVAGSRPAALLPACPTSSETGVVSVAISVNRRVDWGESLAVVGQDTSLGSWQPGQSLPLAWSEGDVWSAVVGLPPGVHEFKCVTLRSNGQLEWEVGCNRVIEVPDTFSGVLEARCNWADTASTVLEAVPASSSIGSTPSAAAESLMEAVACVEGDSMSDALFRSCSSESFNADGSLRSYRLDVPPSLPVSAGPSRTISTSNSGDGGEIQPASPDTSYLLARKLASSAGAQQLEPQQQQQQQQPGPLQPEGSGGSLVSAGSSDDASMYSAYDTVGPFGALSKGGQQQQQLPPLPRPPQQQQQQRGNPLTAASLKQAAAEAAAGMQQQRGPLSVSSSPLSALNGGAGHSMLSPMGTDASGQLPTRAVSSSTLSFSSLEVSEESCGALSDEALGGSEAGSRTDDGQDSLAGGVGAAGAADAAVLLDEQLYSSPCAYEQLMAVEPELLLLEQQQQLLIQQQAEATIEAARHSSSGSGSAFASSTAAAAAAAADEQQALFDAAAELAELDSQAGVGLGAGYLPTEETLPPTALTRFAAGLSEIQEVGDEGEELLDDIPNTEYLSTAADLDSAPDAPSRRRSSSSSTSSRLSKDQLPILGLTVNVPSAAATAAAQMSAASKAAEAAAAAAAAAKARPGHADGDVVEAAAATEGLRLNAAAHIIPHVDKVHTGGEDAYFLSQAGHGALGVSDGVSAWAEDGIDPGEYSRTLVQYCAEAFEERVRAAATAANKGSFIAKFDPRGILRYAQQCTCKPGSATIVLAALQPGGQLHVANLGDCGVKVVREGRVVYETKPQQHDFNLPYQLSHPQLFPDTDTADSADRYVWQVQEGDIIVAASDGLYDNLWDDELVALLQQGLLGIQPLEGAASLSRVDSVSSISSTKGAGRKLGLRGKHSRSSSTSQLPTLLSGSSNALPVFAAAATDPDVSPGEGTADQGAKGSKMSRSRSTSHLSSWGAKQFRSWKNKASGKLAHQHSAAAALPSAAELQEQQLQQQPVRTPAEVTAADISRAAELVAAAAAAHAADKEFKSPWSVAAGRAYGLLARLFAKGGKMDDITCVVAVVQDPNHTPAAPAAAAAPDSQASDAVAAARSSSDLTPSDDSSIGPCLTSEGSVLDEELH